MSGNMQVPRATLYRRRTEKVEKVITPRPVLPRALAAQERQAVLTELQNPRFMDAAPAQVYARLLDEGTYLCSTRTMYRILKAQGQLRERRDQLIHPVYARPELLATGPNQLWSWDITKLKAMAKWTYFHLYVMLDSAATSPAGCSPSGNPTAWPPRSSRRPVPARASRPISSPSTRTAGPR